jgi:preprotein translocase subunit SecD
MQQRALDLNLEYTVVIVSGRDIAVTGPESDEAALQSLASSAAVSFREVLLYAAHDGKAHGDASLVHTGVLSQFNHADCEERASNPDVQIVSCDKSGGKYALDTATITGAEIVSASPRQGFLPGQWQVMLSFNRAGANALAALTTKLANRYYQRAEAGNANDNVLNQIAIVVSGSVVSADNIPQPVTDGAVQIYGSSITQAYAQELATELQPGPLPAALRVVSVRTVTRITG